MILTQAKTLCSATYGAGLLEVDPTCALWVAEKIGTWAAWVAISSARNRVGKGTVFPEFGSACFPSTKQGAAMWDASEDHANNPHA